MSDAKMRAVVVTAPGDWSLEEVPVPDCPEGGLLLAVEACGLCGSDLRTLRHGHRRVELPWILGHEICGIVREVGASCRTRWTEGDRLSVAPLVYCGECDFCIAGRRELCEDYREIAQAWPGGFAEYVAIPAEAVERGSIFAAPEGLEPACAAVAEPVSSCVHAQEKGEVGLGDTVAVIGTGPIGCVHISLARTRGADRIIGLDVKAGRLELAAEFEPDDLVNAAEEDAVEAVLDLTDGQGAEVVITANPVPATQVQAVEMARKGGRVLLFGGLPEDQSTPGIDTNIVHYNALKLIGTTTLAPRHHTRALELLDSDRVPGGKLVTHRLPLSEFDRGVEEAMAGRALKVVFSP